ADSVKAIFELNHYVVEGPCHVHGAEIDLIATPLAGFSSKIYIEVTIEHVENDKYGKDLTKLAMMARIEPQDRRLIVSAGGFSPSVKERAEATGVELLTYDDLLMKFERFEPYISAVLGSKPIGQGLIQLLNSYEEPYFDDGFGHHLATEWLDRW